MSISNLRDKVNNLSNKLTTDNGGKKLEILTNFKSTPTIIARDLKIDGELSGTGIIEIQGNINGVINGNSIILREEGFVNGTIFAENLSIRGRFEGKIKAKHLNITSKARVLGEIQYEILSVEDGACIDGSFKKI